MSLAQMSCALQAKTWAFKHTEESKALLQKIAELCVEYLALQVQAGAQVSDFAVPSRRFFISC